MKLGTLIDNRYRIVRPLAKGGMANIYEGRDGAQRVVIKVLKEGLSKDPEIVARFQREVRTASSLKSKHAVKILGFGTTERDEPFLVMELLFGNDLAKEIQKQRVIGLEDAARIIADTCHAMIEAHQAGVVHRDLKPTNLYLAREAGKQVLKVLDFGIAKITGNASEEQITRPTAVMGSPLYMSPETFKGAMHADARSDIWSLGVIFYEMLTGVVPFKGDNAGAVGVAVMRDPHVPATQIKPQLPHSVDVVIARALKKAPDERYQTMAELLAAIEVYLPKGRHDTMTLAQVVAPPEQDDDARTIRRDISVTDFGMIDPSHTAAAAPTAPTAPTAPAEAAAPAAAAAPESADSADDEPAEAPTRIREPGAADAELATLVQPVPVELSSEDFLLEESVDGTAPGVAPSQRASADMDEALVPAKKKLPVVAWAVPAVALCAGLIGWALGSSKSAEPPASAAASATTAAEHIAPPKTASAPSFPLPPPEPPAAEASASAPAPADSVDQAAAEPLETASAAATTKPVSAPTSWRKPPPKPTSTSTKKQPKFTPKKI